MNMIHKIIAGHIKGILPLLCLLSVSSLVRAQKVIGSEFLKVIIPYSTAIEGEEIKVTYELIKPAIDAQIHIVMFNATKTDSTNSTFTFRVTNTMNSDFATIFLLLIGKPEKEVLDKVQLTFPITTDHFTTLIVNSDAGPVVNKEFPLFRNGSVDFAIGTDKKHCTSIKIREIEVTVSEGVKRGNQNLL
jgi:hypothetical protein